MNPELLDQLEQEHREVEDLFAQLEEASDEDTKRELVSQLSAALTKHMDVEEAQVYPEVAKIEGEMAQEAETEHSLAREGISKLQSLIGQPGFGAAVAMLQAGIDHHVEEEENEVFPKLREALGLPGRKPSDNSDDMTKDELYAKAQEAGVEGRSSMTKDELREAVQ
jgi:hemerythrin superfamily protein